MKFCSIQFLERIVVKVNQILIKFINSILCTLFSVLIFIVMLNVICRYVLKKPLFWVTEFSCYILVYLIFFGAALALYKSEHVCINTKEIKISPAFKCICEKISIVFNYLFIILLIVFGTVVSFENMGSYTGSLPIPMGCVYLAAPLSGVAMFLLYTEYILVKEKGQVK